MARFHKKNKSGHGNQTKKKKSIKAMFDSESEGSKKLDEDWEKILKKTGLKDD